MDSTSSLQDTYGPKTICFGCGPANAEGLGIKSYPAGDMVVASFDPGSHHQAFPRVINGGIIGTLFDCHMNWTAAHHLMNSNGLDHPPVTVTAEFHVKLRRPTPYPGTLHLRARVVESEGSQAVVEAELEADSAVTATCRAVCVAVEEGHPAWYRW